MDALFPPGPQKHLLLGNAVEFRHDPLTAMIDAARNYGEIVHFRFGPSHAYLVTSAEYIHYVLVERPDLFDAQPHFYRAIQSALGHELFAPGDGVHKRQHPSAELPSDWLKLHCDTITNAAAELCSSWKHGDSDVYQALRDQTVGIAAKIVFGLDADDTIRQFAAAVENSAVLRDRRFVSPWAVRLLRHDKALEFAVACVSKRRFQPTHGQDALSLLVDACLSEREIASRLIRLFHALHESAATTLAWAMHLLAQNPEQQAELRSELNTVLAGRLPTAADLPELAYSEMVLRETMRLYPPAWLVSRQTRRETRIGDFFLPAGSTVLCSPYIMQRSPRNYVEPQKFLPERFSASFEKRMRRHAYAPFGTDGRLEGAPLMAEMKLLLAAIASRFEVSSVGSHPVAFDPLLSLRPKGGLQIQFTACSDERTAVALASE